MSQGRFSSPPLAPEDDWFYEPDVPPSAGREELRESDTGHPEPRRTQPPQGERDRRLLVAAIVSAIVLLAGGVLIARALTGSDGGGEERTSTLPTTAPTTTTPTTLPEGVVLRRGDESGDVSQVQAALVELGYSTGGIDGKFGKATEQAVRDFQKSSDLAADGVVGPATLAALSAALSGQ